MKRLIPVAKVLVSAGLLIFLFKIIDLKSFKETLTGIDPLYLVLSIGLMFCILILASLRWRLCLLPQGIDISIGNTIKYSIIGFFFNNFAPSTVGGDVAKGVIVGRSSRRKLGTAISIIMDRSMGLLTTGVLAFFALLISFNLALDNRIRGAIVLFVSIIILFLFLMLNKTVSHKLAGFLASHRLSHIADKILSVSDAFSSYRTYPGFIKKTLTLSLMLQMLNICVTFFLARGLGIRISFLYFMVFMPLIAAVMSIPVSLNGLGLREGAFVVFFSLASVSREGALAISIAYYTIILILSLIGGVVLLRSGFRKERGKND